MHKWAHNATKRKPYYLSIGVLYKLISLFGKHFDKIRAHDGVYTSQVNYARECAVQVFSRSAYAYKVQNIAKVTKNLNKMLGFSSRH